MQAKALTSFFALITLVPAPAQAQWAQQSLSTPRKGPVAVSVNGKSLFAGGLAGGAGSTVVDIYDHASDTWSEITLSSARNQMGVTALGDFAFFAGGADSPFSVSDVVDILDTQDMSWSQANLTQARAAIMATTVGDKAIFAGGGFIGMGIQPSDVVDIYDASLGVPADPAAWSVATLHVARGAGAATTAGTKAIFAGGTSNLPYQGPYFDEVDIYDCVSDTWIIGAPLSEPRAYLAATAVGDHAYFGGGLTASGRSDVIDIYDASADSWSTSGLSEARGYLAATSLGNTVLFAGGDSNSGYSSVVDQINVGTGLAVQTVLSQARYDLCATSLEGKALFAGGHDGAGPSDVVDVYEPLGINYCLATANSTGGAATISATGTSSIAANDLFLRADPVPNQFGVFFYGPRQTSAAFGNGTLCISGEIGRLDVVIATGNVMTHLVDNTSPPSTSTQITSGSTWNFQAWFRDPAAGGAFFDLSDGLVVTFAP